MQLGSIFCSNPQKKRKETNYQNNFAAYCTIDKRNKFPNINIPFRKIKMGQKVISLVGPSPWNSLLELNENTDNWNTLSIKLKVLNNVSKLNIKFSLPELNKQWINAMSIIQLLLQGLKVRLSPSKKIALFASLKAL